MKTEKIDIYSVEQWNERYADDPYAISRAQQLSHGRMEYQAATVSFDELHIEWDHFGARIRRRDVPRPGFTLIGLTMHAVQPSKLCGEELDYGDVYIIQSGIEADHVTMKDTRELWFALAPKLAEKMCIIPSHDLIKRVNKIQLQKLITTCQKAVYQPGDCQDQVLADLYALIEPWRTEVNARQRSTTASRHFNLFRRAEKLLPDTTSGEVAKVDRIADLLGVSRRTIFQIFQSSIGMAPASYQRLKQLHALRKLLVATKPGSRTVTELATSSGFSHLGRMYVDYHNHFGETPRSTLQR